MIISFVTDESIEVEGQLSVVYKSSDDIKEYFKDRNYGDDLQKLLIRLVCNSPKFLQYHKERKPKYRREGKVELIYGTQQQTDARCLTYQIILDFSKYYKTDKEIVKKNLAEDILNSLDVIDKVKQIKDFEMVKFRSDLNNMFRTIGWL